MDDDVIPFLHGQQIHERAPKPLEPLWLEREFRQIFFKIYEWFLGAGHNDIEVYPEYLERLKRLVKNELDWWILGVFDKKPAWEQLRISLLYIFVFSHHG